MKWKPPVKIPDLVIIFLALALTGLSAFTAYIKPQKTIQVLIQGQGRKWIFPLDAVETVHIPGPLGLTTVKIHENMAWVESSPCQNQTCVASGRIRHRGAWAACLPNNVFLMIEGSDGSANPPDAGAW